MPDAAMPNQNLYALFTSRFPADRTAPFLEHDQGVTSFALIDERSAHFAAVLKTNGATPGDRVIVQIKKSPEAVMLYLACLRIGVAFVPLNTAYTIAELAYFINDANPSVVICDPQDETEIAGLCRDRTVILTLDDTGSGSLINQINATSTEPEIIHCKGDEIAAILYTSGTTGRAKGAMLTHDNLASNAQMLHAYWQWQPDDVLLHALPIFHVHGLFVALHCALLNGSKVVFHNKFDVDAIIDDLPKSTVLMGVPTFYTRLLGNPGFTTETCRNMRLFISGSAPLLPGTFKDFKERSGYTILERYGMTEAGMITSNPYIGKRIAGTVGYPLPGVKARVVDTDGHALTSGDVGVLEISGPSVFAGYWQMPGKTADEFREDGYFITGDMALMDTTGRITIVGRTKDLIITGGYNVYPKEVEIEIDKISGIKETAVVGIPHADYGEAVTAIIVADENVEINEDGVRTAISTQIAKFKQPIRLIFIPELPRNTMGKVQKNALRQTYANLYN